MRRFSGSSEENFQKILEIYTHKTKGYKAHEPKYSTQRLNFNEVVEFYKEK